MFRFFKKKKPRTLLDDFNDAAAKMYRPLLNNKKISDEKLLDIVRLVMNSFKEAAESKGEVISGVSLTKISMKFVIVFDMCDEKFFMEHLKYEVDLYLNSGLREDYL